MGIAAYRRGSTVISRQLDNTPFEEHPGAAYVRERIDAIPAGDVRFFGSTIARPEPGPSGGWWLMHKKERGYGEYGRY